MMLSEANDVGLALIIGGGLLDSFPWVAGVGPVVLLSDRPDHRLPMLYGGFR